MDKNNRKKEAQEHHQKILQNDEGDIKRAITYSTVYAENNDEPNDANYIIVEETDCLSAAINIRENIDSRAPITILNFASFTKPGGGYMNGSLAQEEYLCAESNLWEILNDEEFAQFYADNKEDTNNGLYYNRAIFTPNVKFHRDGKEYFFNVLTCAAPNCKAALNNKISFKTIVKTYASRVSFIYNILNKNNQEYFVSGAWGCGVFGFPREVSKNIFSEKANIHTVLAIPSKDSKFQNKQSNER